MTSITWAVVVIAIVEAIYIWWLEWICNLQQRELERFRQKGKDV